MGDQRIDSLERASMNNVRQAKMNTSARMWCDAARASNYRGHVRESVAAIE